MRERDWIVIGVRCSPEASEAVHEILAQAAGRPGTAEERLGNACVVTVYVPADDHWADLVAHISDRLVAVRAAFGRDAAGEPAVTCVSDRDWASAWRRHYRPITVDRVVIKPSWLPGVQVPAGHVVVELDPQMAFGTGAHVTTQIALAALQESLKPGHAIADVGTGTGILAIAAAKLGAAAVYAVDNDPVAVKAARDNSGRNGVEDIVRVELGELLAPVPTGLDGIVANISPHADIELTRCAPRHLRPGGFLILAGFTHNSEPDVQGTLRAAGFCVERRLQDGEWVCLTGRLPLAPGPNGTCQDRSAPLPHPTA